MAFSITIKGIDDLQNKFEEKRKEIEEALIKDVGEAADVVKVSMKSKIHPVSEDLEEAIDRDEVWNHDGKIDVHVGVDVTEEFTPTGLYGIAVEKGHETEYGTSKVKAHPFLRPALNENKKQIQSNMENHLKEIIGGEQ